MSITELSRRTETPIEYVPLIIFYFNGQPVMEYTENKDPAAITNFINNLTSDISKRQNKFIAPGSDIPAFTIGRPKRGDDVCYLTFDETAGYKK